MFNMSSVLTKSNAIERCKVGSDKINRSKVDQSGNAVMRHCHL